MLFRFFYVHFNGFVRGSHRKTSLQLQKPHTIAKRAEMLMKLVKNNEKKKNWHLQLGATGSPEKNIYDKVPRPNKRASVLNSLFMENITDVLATGGVCPEVMGYGIEITGVRVTSDYQIVNVFWQIPNTSETYNIDVDEILAKSAPHIRGELIRRNMLGKVPRIYFIRDPTNKRSSEFQKCLELSGVSEIKDPPSIPADELLKDIYKFTEGRAAGMKKNVVEEKEKPKVVPRTMPFPEKPPDMKLDVMGLNHEQIFNRVLDARKKPKVLPGGTLPILSHLTEVTEDGEGFKKQKVNTIQADPLFNNIDREKQIKKFCKEQKTKWAKTNKDDDDDEESVTYVLSDITDDATEDFEEDYFEEEDENEGTGHKPV